MCRPVHLLVALAVLVVPSIFTSTEGTLTSQQCLSAYYTAKRIVTGAAMSSEEGRCSQWRGVTKGRNGRKGRRNRHFGRREDWRDIFPGFNGTDSYWNRTDPIGNNTLIFSNGTLIFPNGTQLVLNASIIPVNGKNPQLLSVENLAVAENGLVLAEATRILQDAAIAANLDPVNVISTLLRPDRIRQECPFNSRDQCDRNYPYRTADGTCNNLRASLLGSSNTPLGRYLPAVYSDGIDLPRENGVSGSPLPGARLISTTLHSQSTPDDRDTEQTHLTPVFGLFLSHDVSNFPTFPTTGDGILDILDCCTANDTAVCFPIEIPEDDAYFGQYERTCMAYVRTLPSSTIDCAFGSRQQLNLATSYIDASQIYGYNAEIQNRLRTMSGGRLITQATESLDLLPADDATLCASEENLCFLSGDHRVNFGPALMALHTIFFREHNRIADALSAAHSNWTDEIIFQEARRIVIAEMQHISYGEYLPKFVGNNNMELFNLKPLFNGTTRYARNINPNARNSFVAAGVFSGHSAIRSTITIGDIEYALSSIFFNPDIFYEGSDGPTLILQGLTSDMSQMIDRLMSDELTNKFVELSPGNGWDLAARNIQTGRDHGLPTYVNWRRWCGLSVPENFTTLVDHNNEVQTLLEQIYADVEDIDLWSGAVSEMHVDGGRVGPTFACLIGRQTQALKFGDRFWYENGGRFGFSTDELESIRSVTLSRILCDNTNIEQIQTDPFLRVSDTNPQVPCSDIQQVDFCPFVREWTDWSTWTDCLENTMSANRTCTGPLEGPCSCTEDMLEIRTRPCNLNIAVAA